MPVIDVTPVLVGPLPWVPALPPAARVAVAVIAIGGAVLTVIVLGRSSKQPGREP